MKWSIPTSSIRGYYHQQTDTTSQDFVRQYISDDFACVALCDGAGSAKYASEGARFVAEQTCEILKIYQFDLFNFSDDEIRKVILDRILNALQKLGNEDQYNCSIQSFSTTLLFFASNGVHYVAGNIGDGIIGYQDDSFNLKMILGQDRGLYANESYFVTSPHSDLHFRLSRGSFNSYYVYFLMTDGSCDCLYNYRTKTFAKALDIFCRWCRKYSRTQINKALFESMQRLFYQKTNDDCAIAFITEEPANLN